MRNLIAFILICLTACSNEGPVTKPDTVAGVPIIGTWKLISGTLIEKGDTTVTDYTKDQSFIKIINDSHFAFLKHSLNQPKDSSNQFSAGGGKYSLDRDNYTEHLEYCSDKEWEHHDFSFTVTISGDMLVQQGREKVEATGVDRLNIERYVKMTKR